MRHIVRIALGLTLVIFLSQGCNSIPSTEEIDEDLKLLNSNIEEANNDSKKYAGGVIKSLIDLRMETLNNTKEMLNQKKKGLKRFVKINYTIDGKSYSRPNNYDELIKKIDNEMNKVGQDISEAQQESDMYSGGLLKVMIETRIVTLKYSLALLKQKRLSLKHNIPIYFSPSIENEQEDNRKPMGRSDLDNL